MNGKTPLTRPPHSKETPARRGHQGAAFLLIVPSSILAMALGVAFVGTSVETSRAASADSTGFRAHIAAESAASMAFAMIWSGFERRASDDTSLSGLRGHLDELGVIDRSAGAAADPANYLEGVGLAINARSVPELDGVEIERIDVHRIDAPDSTSIVIAVTALSPEGPDGAPAIRSTLRETFSVAPIEGHGLAPRRLRPAVAAGS